MAANFSIAIIARNGLKSLGDLLPQLTQFIEDGNEVVLVDTGSTDGTQKIATLHGCTVYEKHFVEQVSGMTADAINKAVVCPGEQDIIQGGDIYFHFANARNYAASNCRNKYVMVLDCDMQLQNFDYKKISEMLYHTQLDKYYAKWLWDEGTQHEIDCILLYNRTKCQYVGAVHETVEGGNYQGAISKDIFYPVHYADDKPRGQYLTGLAHQWYLKQDNARSTHYLGRELHYQKRNKSAISMLNRHVKMTAAWIEERRESAVIAGYASWELQLDPEQWWLMAFELSPARRPLIALATYYKMKQQWQKCACYASAAMEIPYAGQYMDSMANYGDVPLGLRYVARSWMGNVEGAQEDYMKAKALAPGKYDHDEKIIFPNGN